MRPSCRWTITVLLICIIPLLAACEEVVDSPTPSDADGAAVSSLPTRTVKPIVSFTPRFTATPLPSATPTASDTPVATDTPVPPTPTPTVTPSSTPTIGGVVRSTQNVNLREGPSLGAPIVVSVEPGTELMMLNVTTDARGTLWYEVLYVPEDDGDSQRLWIAARLVDTDAEAVRVRATAQAGGPVAEDDTPSPASTFVENVPPTLVPGAVNVLAYCQQKNVQPPRITTDDYVYIEWSWYVSREEYMPPHLENANYTVELDGEPLTDWEQYASELRREAGRYYVYWYYPVGQLSEGEHTVSYQLTWDEAITDGYDDFGPDTANATNEGTCTFTVNAS